MQNDQPGMALPGTSAVLLLCSTAIIYRYYLALHYGTMENGHDGLGHRVKHQVPVG